MYERPEKKWYLLFHSCEVLVTETQLWGETGHNLKLFVLDFYCRLWNLYVLKRFKIPQYYAHVSSYNIGSSSV